MTEVLRLSSDVRIHSVRKRSGARGTTYVARWRVSGKDRQSTFPTAKLADGFRSSLLSAARSGEPFSVATGLPVSMSPAAGEVTWIEHGVDFIRMKWPDSAPKYRKSLAESLTAITVPLISNRSSRYSLKEIRQCLFRWVFAAPDTGREPPAELQHLVSWLNDHSRPISDLADPSVIREVLDAISLKLDGTRASNSTIALRRSALYNCVDYAVERQRLAKNPLTEVRRKRLPPTAPIDRRRVANPTQARRLIVAVAENDPELEAFFATLYYVGARPAEVMNLRRDDCTLPDEGWGLVLLSSSYQRPGIAWTGSGEADEERQLKHRSKQDTRPVPANPALVKILRNHISTHELGPDGRLFVSRTGNAGRPLSGPYTKPVSMNTVYRAWHRARTTTLTPEQCVSQLARRPYDLRHACLSTWLNAGVAPVQVAEWAGHSVAVLLSTYAKCLDGQESAALERIQNALDAPDQ